jgi:nucleoside-diphosphate-sugar epimerase
VLELFHKLTGNDHEPKMTRFLALQLARSHYFSHQKATRELGYRPIVSLDEGKKRLLAWLNR